MNMQSRNTLMCSYHPNNTLPLRYLLWYAITYILQYIVFTKKAGLRWTQGLKFTIKASVHIHGSFGITEQQT